MKKDISPLVMAMMAVAFIASAPASAQSAKQGMSNNMPAFVDIDVNEDGQISASEFTKARSERLEKRAKEGRKMKNLANAPSFDDIDTDNNGGLSTDEFAAHQAECKAKKSQRGSNG